MGKVLEFKNKKDQLTICLNGTGLTCLDVGDVEIELDEDYGYMFKMTPSQFQTWIEENQLWEENNEIRDGDSGFIFGCLLRS